MRQQQVHRLLSEEGLQQWKGPLAAVMRVHAAEVPILQLKMRLIVDLVGKRLASNLLPSMQARLKS